MISQSSLVLRDDEQLVQFFAIFKNRLRLAFGTTVYSACFDQMSFMSVSDDLLIVGCDQRAKVEVSSRHLEKVLKILRSSSDDFLKYRLNLINIVERKSSVAIQSSVADSDVAVMHHQRSNGVSSSSGFEFLSRKDDFKYSFNEFIVSETNSIAYSVLRSVSDDIFNCAGHGGLVFINGTVGNGKTHLLHSLARDVLERNGRTKILYSTSEKFLLNYIKSIKGNSLLEFKKEILSADVLLVDDIHFLASKKSTFDELCNVSKSLISEGKVVIFASSQSPYKMNVEALSNPEQIRSFITSGVNVSVANPGYHLRFEILKLKAKKYDCEIPNDVIEFLSTNFHSNVRELDAVINKLRLNHDVLNQEITLSLAKNILSEMISIPSSAKEKDLHNKLVLTVCEYYNVSESDVLSQKRSESIMNARQVSMFLLSKVANKTLMEIASIFGKKSHGTVLYAIKLIDEKISMDEILRSDVIELSSRIRNNRV